MNKKNNIFVIFLLLIFTILNSVLSTNVYAANSVILRTLIDKNSNWKFEDNNIAQNDSWVTPEFDDKSWKSGNAPLGYPANLNISYFGKISNGTLVNNNKSGNAIITYYYRKDFNLENINNISKLDFRFGVDDGIVIYLNGSEISRFNMPTGIVTHATNASSIRTSEYKLSLFPSQFNRILHNGKNEIAVEIHNRNKNSSDIYFDMELKASYEEQAAASISSNDIVSPKITDISMTPGKDETQMNFLWYSTKDIGNATVLLAFKDDTSTKFPLDNAKSFSGITTKASSGKFSNKVSINGLLSNTEYVYKVGNGNEWSASYTFKTANTKSFNFLFMGDPQIGASGLSSDTASWANTLKKGLSMFPNTNMIFSAGDQANSASETEYSAFLSPSVLKNIPVATTQGNHDELGTYYNYHFNNPNTSLIYGVSRSGSDYYFVQNNALFIVLNSNNANTASHSDFVRAAVNANTNVKWKIVMFHHSIYSSSVHSSSSSIVERRNTLTPVFEQNGIDVVLMGHDHTYTRTYQMLGNLPQKNQSTNEKGDVVYNPTGILYITANSSTGSKYYTLNSGTEIYSAIRQQLKVPTFLNVNIDDNSIQIKGIRVDNGQEFDSYKIVKD